MKNIYKYFITSILILIIDIVWINLVMAKPFKKIVKNIQNSNMEMNYYYAILSYLSILVLVNLFIFYKKINIYESFILGSMTYAIFEFTNGAIFKNWNIYIAMLDIIWGGILFVIAKLIFDNI